MNDAETARVMLNGKLLPAAAAMISPLSEGFLYGYGVFETMKVSAGRPQLWDDHVARLSDSTRALGLAYPCSGDGLLQRCLEVIQANGARDVALKITVFQDVGGVSELISLRPNPYTAEMYKKGFAVKTVPRRGSAERVSRCKTLNYLGNLLELRAARAQGVDEVIFVDEQARVLEGATTNVFVVKNGVVCTPPLALGILPGVMRAHVLRTDARPAEERELSVKELMSADAVFLTNAVLGVMPVRQVDKKTFAV